MKCLWFITAKGSRNRQQQIVEQKLEGGYYYYFQLKLWLLPLVHSAFCILHSLGIFVRPRPLFLLVALAKMLTTFCLAALFTPLHSTPAADHFDMNPVRAPRLRDVLLMILGTCFSYCRTKIVLKISSFRNEWAAWAKVFAVFHILLRNYPDFNITAS